MEPFFEKPARALRRLAFRRFSFLMLKVRPLAARFLCNERCAFCGKSGALLCKPCAARIFEQQTRKPRCARCGHYLPALQNAEKEAANAGGGEATPSGRGASSLGGAFPQGGGFCPQCLRRPVFDALDSALPLFPYSGAYKKLLELWKAGGNRQLAFVFAQWLAESCARHYPALPLVPVPPRPAKVFNEGWDQVRDLAQVLRYAHGLQVLDILLRVDSRQQKFRSRRERLDAGERYTLNKRYSSAEAPRAPQSVVLLDDVMTTGATLEECAKLLKRLGVARVFALTLFYVEDPAAR